MLHIKVIAPEIWIEETSEFAYRGSDQELVMEHSLVSISKWESKWRKPFLSGENKSVEEIVDYAKCMTVTQNVPPSVYENLTEANIQEIKDYIDTPMTATKIRRDRNGGGRSGESITSELIYYWMVSYNIPFECQRWHLSRLLALIEVCNVKNKPPKKMNGQERLARNAAVNAANRKRFHTNG